MTTSRRSRMGTLREATLPAILGAIVLVMIGVSISSAQRPQTRPYDPDSAAPDGVRTLRLWLGEMGYDVKNVGRQRFALPVEASILFSFPGEQPFDSADVAVLREWVKDGGTAVLVSQTMPWIDDALSTDPSVWSYTIPYSTVHQGQPMLPEAAPQWETLPANSRLLGDIESRMVAVTHSPDGDVASAVVRMGEGWVWLLGPAHPLTNESLREPNQAAVATALLRGVPAGATVLFDDYHLLGEQSAATMAETPIVSLQDWLYQSAIGRALVFGLGALALYWVLAGRRLGPPLPAPEELRRREAAEYVRAMASLKQRARTLGEVANHRRLRLKAALARSGHVDAKLGDAEFVRRLGQEGVLDRDGMRRVEGVLASLAAANGEQAVVKAAAEADLIASATIRIL